MTSSDDEKTNKEMRIDEDETKFKAFEREEGTKRK